MYSTHCLSSVTRRSSPFSPGFTGPSLKGARPPEVARPTHPTPQQVCSKSSSVGQFFHPALVGQARLNSCLRAVRALLALARGPSGLSLSPYRCPSTDLLQSAG